MRGAAVRRGDRHGIVPLAVAAGATAWAASEVLALRRVVVLLERCGRAPVPELAPEASKGYDLPFFLERGISVDHPPAA